MRIAPTPASMHNRERIFRAGRAVANAPPAP
jgi:hypothetical protein